MLKPAHHYCPHCGGVCAEYAKYKQPMRWTCNLCGREGLIEVEAQEVREAVKPVHKHWSELGDKGLRVHAASVFRSPIF